MRVRPPRHPQVGVSGQFSYHFSLSATIERQRSVGKAKIVEYCRWRNLGSLAGAPHCAGRVDALPLFTIMAQEHWSIARLAGRRAGEEFGTFRRERYRARPPPFE
jgi:hypothetical protein